MGFIQDITLRLDGDLTKPYGEAKISFAGRCSAPTVGRKGDITPDAARLSMRSVQ